MAEVQISLGNIQFANLYGNKVLQMDPEKWRAHHIVGATLSMMGDFDTGIPYIKKAIALNPDHSTLLFNLCSIYHTAKQYDNAVQTCTEVLQRKDHQLQGPTYILRGEAYLGLNQQKKAQQDFNKAKFFGIGEDSP